MRTRSTPQEGAFGDTPRLSLQRLMPRRDTLLSAQEFESSPPGEVPIGASTPACPHERRGALVTAFFAVTSDQDSSAFARLVWPRSLKGSKLEKVVVRDGFCPSPERFNRADTDQGFGGENFVFTLLETALDDAADPDGVLYGCVCGAQAYAFEPMVIAESIALEGGDQPCVFCIVSKLPLFAFHFELLEILRASKDLHHAEHILDRVSSTGLADHLASGGVDFADLQCGVHRLSLKLPRSTPCDWHCFEQGPFAVPLSFMSQALAQWQVSWGLEMLLAHWDNLVGDTLAKLVACVLLEQKILLLGDVPRISAMALVLRALVWPFRWLHPFLTAPPPPDFMRTPLVDAPFPVFMALTELPAQWGFRTPYDLPTDVAVGMLKHDYVYIADAHQTAGGLKAANIKLPAGRHTAFLKQVAQAKQKLRRQELDLQQAGELVQRAVESEVLKLAEVIQQYAKAQVALAAAEGDTHPPLPNPASQSAGMGRACSKKQSTFSKALDCNRFMEWLTAERPDTCGGSEAIAFYSTFFRTQLCLDLLSREIVAQTAVGQNL